MPTVNGLPVPKLRQRGDRVNGYYCVTAVDSRGRLGDRSALRRMGWSATVNIDLKVDDGLIVVKERPFGLSSITQAGFLRLKPAVQEGAGIQAGDRVLVAAYPRERTFMVFTMAFLESALAARLAL